ncbi:dynein_attach_N domain-containing protein [Trichonephila inaurata madagascariensis]|uniref:Dynein_attach_N domain-containing protein n=1 Tax=Trichonephila inaurata madagascariensis TaxID=2747483 RepID=A0A8X7CCB4_9ARAC|nr:dynein_attach_N domain-containing protein [Trichonephila inaurata madagascariensis]
MVSIDDDNINFNTLLNNLEESIEADRVYKLRNAAKIRAVNQPRTSYEDFENIVKGATLKPLDKKEHLSCNPRHTWNPIAKKLEEDSIDEVFMKKLFKK